VGVGKREFGGCGPGTMGSQSICIRLLSVLVLAVVP